MRNQRGWGSLRLLAEWAEIAVVRPATDRVDELVDELPNRAHGPRRASRPERVFGKPRVGGSLH